ncbi:MAG TPA: cell division protein FtsQ/DivIB [Methylophilaceae bacterium]|nr:cell division protein FtsQ/DivIB [Methylophilaceae bacterium]HQC27830.1 cell division protein FtsQ/DivIB [Methylotenera sp.]
MWDKPKLLNWIANLLFALSMVAILYAVLYAVVHLPIFPLREVKIDGQLNHVSREQVKLIVSKHLKGNFFTLDLMKARGAFEKLPWARNVSIRRRWPDKLEVVVEEHQELARWGSTALVNTHGELFYAATNSELPIFNGPADSVIEVASHYGEFSKTLNEANLKIASLTLTPRRAWEVTTSSGMLIELGRVEMQNRIEKFANVYVSTIAGLNKKIVYADLRYPNGFAVRRPAADLKQMEEKVKEVNAIKKKPVAQVKPKPTDVSQQI